MSDRLHGLNKADIGRPFKDSYGSRIFTVQGFANGSYPVVAQSADGKISRFTAAYVVVALATYKE